MSASELPPAPGKRARNRAAVEGEILAVARRHLATRGAAALSLRAVARDLGMVSSGIYRYVESRDELLTRLIVESFTSLSRAVGSAHDAVPPADLVGRWDALGHGLRRWALDHPHDFALLYGSPVPDYEAPADRTVEPGTAVQALLVALLADTHRSGHLADTVVHATGVRAGVVEAAVAPLLTEPMFAGTDLDAAALAQGLGAWTLLLGAVTSEVFGQLGPLPDRAALFEVLLATARSLVIAPAWSPDPAG